MPMYEYECLSCHRRVEKIQKFSDAPLTDCPHCGGHLERTVTAPSVQFAGGGWYKDLYSSAKPGTGGSSSSTDSAGSASAPAAKPTDAAPASATPSAPKAS